MRIFKRLNDNAFESLKRGVIRIGSLAYYRRIEMSERADADEGPIGAVIHAQVGDVELSAEQINRVNEQVGSRYRFSPKVKLVLRKGTAFRIDSDINLFVFCTTIDAFADDNLSKKFGRNVVEIVDAAGFSKFISVHLHKKVIVEKCLDLKGKADCIGGAFEPVSYRDKEPRAFHELIGNGVDMSGVFIKPPRHYEDEREFRFAWIPLWSKDGTACPLPIGFKYLDLKLPDVWKYLK